MLYKLWITSINSKKMENVMFLAIRDKRQFTKLSYFSSPSPAVSPSPSVSTSPSVSPSPAVSPSPEVSFKLLQLFNLY